MIIAFNKPYGVLNQFTEQIPGQRTLKEFNFPPHVYPIGRLDMDSEGLLLLSDEKAWTDRLLNPDRAHTRTYHVQVEGIASDEAISKLSRGVMIQGWKTKPCLVKKIEDPGYGERNPPIRFRKTVPTSWIQIILTEGKNRQVRRMTASVGFPALRLVRVAVGCFELGKLKPGTWQELTTAQKQQLLIKKLVS